MVGATHFLLGHHPKTKEHIVKFGPCAVDGTKGTLGRDDCRRFWIQICKLVNIMAVEVQIRMTLDMAGEELVGLRRVEMAMNFFSGIKVMLNVPSDIHGQYSDLLRLFEYGGLPPQANYLFLGDYVDRGKQSLETICLLLAYKVKYPNNFFLLRGNHECASINRIYGFYDECKRRFNVKLWKTFSDCFNCLPVAALIDEKILCMHGGLSPDLHNLDQISNLRRPTDVPDSGLLCDLLWSDPCVDVKGWGMNDRGVSFTFGADTVTEFLEKHDLDLVCRAHQVVEDGYEFFANRQLVTVFSAPNYCGEFDNAGAMMSVDETLMCSFQILKPAEKKSKVNSGISLFGSTTTAKPGNTPAGIKADYHLWVMWVLVNDHDPSIVRFTIKSIHHSIL
ncbi:hypothetical protein E3N88_06696 [Mikania micrantha]|uniref:Serine/threonine-protein phosphatase n=1 Tax=Mikania micrantha TaxID=192012 RepID=A0A5N6PRW1_9ASTR|nr:hypothetical protein E3N88_06696 [Mikania micrantha]